MMMTRWMTKLAAVAFVAAPVAIAHAATQPTIVVLHRDIKNVQDEENWRQLARGLSADGFRVVSLAMSPSDTPEASRTELLKLIDEAGPNERVVLVGTSSASDTITSVAQTEPQRVKALVYVSASDAVPAFGPRHVNVPVSLTGLIPTYQVKVSKGKVQTARTEGSATIFRVREEGKSTLGRTDEMIATIEEVNRLTNKTPVAGAPAALLAQN